MGFVLSAFCSMSMLMNRCSSRKNRPQLMLLLTTTCWSTGLSSSINVRSMSSVNQNGRRHVNAAKTEHTINMRVAMARILLRKKLAIGFELDMFGSSTRRDMNACASSGRRSVFPREEMFANFYKPHTSILFVFICRFSTVFSVT